MILRCRVYKIAFLLLFFGVVASPALAASNVWRDPAYAAPKRKALIEGEIDEVEGIYAYALQLQSEGAEECVDQFFLVAFMTADQSCGERIGERTSQLHRSSLQKLVATGQQFGRLDPRCGIQIHMNGQSNFVPVSHHGFVWSSGDFHRLTAVGYYRTKAVNTVYRQSGLGVPVVVTSFREQPNTFRPEQSVFSATLRLRKCSFGESVDNSLDGVRLELYDPLRVDAISVAGEQRPIAKDLTAPIAYRIQSRSSGVLEQFIRPNSVSPDTGSSQGMLYTLEPYQVGKTPLVLIHGLLSDPFTWAGVVNELIARPEFVDRFQIWVYEYPTGKNFLGSAAQLRSQLECACRQFDPQHLDPQLSNIVLAGHSMGGLIAKMQITDSGNQLWNSVAKIPLGSVVATPQLRHRLAQIFYFAPSPRVTRVVYIATPHRGSSIATRMVGRVGSWLVNSPEQDLQQYDELLLNNAGMFSSELSRRIPTSIDLLEPQSRLLQASDALPVRCGVVIHSIVGDKCLSPTLQRSDGVVPVESARDRRAVTERFVAASHTKIKEHPDSIEELISILEIHLKQQGRCPSLGLSGLGQHLTVGTKTLE